MKQFLLILAVVALAGCGKEDLSPPLESMANGEGTGNTSNPIKIYPPKHTTDSFEQIQKRIAKNEAVLVDVREKFEWEDGHLQSAIFLPLSDLEEWESDKSYVLNLAKKISKDKIIYCHCVSGGRVMPASAILQKIGYDVRPLKPGYKDLLKAGFEKAK